jgi:hypothetical protein
VTDDLFTAKQLAERGISESHEHAEEVDAGWTERAVKAVAEYAKLNEMFLAEDAKAWAYESGLEVPPVDGAWGSVMRLAAGRGIIHPFGRKAASSPGSHGKLMRLWRRGPGNIEAPAVTAEEADRQASLLHEFGVQMGREGRIMLREALFEAERTMRALASDL